MKTDSPARWLFPSIGDVVFLCIFFWILKSGLGLLNDGDTGWHIVTGNIIIDTLKIPFADPFSHTMPGTPWTAHEWLAEVIFASIHRMGGLNAVVVFTAALIGATCLLLYRYMLHIKVSPLLAAVFTVFAAIASSLHWLARPHVFSFVLTLGFIVVLELYQREDKDYLKFLPIMMVAWVNLHAGYILGIMLMVIYAAGNLVMYAADRPQNLVHIARAKRLGIFIVLTVVATSVNPHGPAILYFPFHLVGRQYIMDNILEWLSPNFHTDKVFEAMLLYMAAIFVLSKKKPDIIEGVTMLLMVHMSLYSARYIPLLALIVMPMAASRTGEVLDGLSAPFVGIGTVGRVKKRLLKISENITPLEYRFDRHLWVYVAVVICIGVSMNGGMVGDRKLMAYTHDKKIFPVDAMAFVKENHIKGKMYNNDGWGGYIIYTGYPEYKVFFDGRSDMYGVDFLKEYIRVARAELGYMDILDKYGVGWAIFSANSPLCQLLAGADGWKLVYADTTADVLVRDIPEYRGLVEKYPGVKFVRKTEDD